MEALPEGGRTETRLPWGLKLLQEERLIEARMTFQRPESVESNICLAAQTSPLPHS